jgi:hypothetical protein
MLYEVTHLAKYNIHVKPAPYCTPSCAGHVCVTKTLRFLIV